MGCGSSNQVNVNDPSTKENQVKISNFEENQKEQSQKNQDFFNKIQKMKLPENPEQSQMNIRQKRKQRELKQSGFLQMIVNNVANDDENVDA